MKLPLAPLRRFGGHASAAKYRSGNPISRLMVDNFVSTVLDLARQTGAVDVHEVGSGEGQIAILLAEHGLKIRGSDISDEYLEVARREAARAGLDIEYRVRDIYRLDESDSAELVVCCEVLEHLPDPATAMQKLAAIAKAHLIVSVPREPIWRILNLARLKYVDSLGNTPGHVNHWSRKEFVAFVSKYIVVDEVRNPLPWTAVLGRPKR